MVMLSKYLIFAEKLNYMKKLLFTLIVLVWAGCSKQNAPITELPEIDRKLLKEVIVEYEETDSVYVHYGICKEIYRIFNYEYKDSVRIGISYHRKKNGEGISVDAYVNEYGDTVLIEYTDLYNYPRREDPRFAD